MYYIETLNIHVKYLNVLFLDDCKDDPEEGPGKSI